MTDFSDKGKSCQRCGEYKPVADFWRQKATKDGLQSYCKPCKKSDQLESRRKSPAVALKYKYNITMEEYLDRLNRQNGVCAICKEQESAISEWDGEPKRLSVDHDHRCCPGHRSCGKCVRGLICRRCNSMLGNSSDSPEILELAAMYLRSYLD